MPSNIISVIIASVNCASNGMRGYADFDVLISSTCCAVLNFLNFWGCNQTS